MTNLFTCKKTPSTFKCIVCDRYTMSEAAKWGAMTSSLDPSQKELLVGGSLSSRFSKLPLWLSHPSNIGGFYGFLVSIALILPYAMTEKYWFQLWILHCSLLVFATALLGMASRLLNLVTKRMPMSVNRKILYSTPFLGFGLITMVSTDLISNSNITQYLAWGLMMLPGPLYIHISWAPRWRLLCMIEDELNPFENYDKVDLDEPQEVTEVAGQDSDLIEIIEELDSEE